MGTVNNYCILRAAALALLCLFIFILGGCAVNPATDTVVCNDDEYSVYPEAVAALLPSYTVETNNVGALFFLGAGMAAE
ncbi:MAG: hypothetical protein LBH28_05520, partial [Oscillospiraceae bacterium]|nr:hypothetical protein [Oscillospiraceae bacterium]